jgi:hypothetical protein
MSEGWLFRLRTSLGAGRAAPAWPESPRAARDGDAPALRRPAPTAARDVTPDAGAAHDAPAAPDVPRRR